MSLICVSFVFLMNSSYCSTMYGAVHYLITYGFFLQVIKWYTAVTEVDHTFQLLSIVKKKIKEILFFGGFLLLVYFFLELYFSETYINYVIVDFVIFMYINFYLSLRDYVSTICSCLFFQNLLKTHSHLILLNCKTRNGFMVLQIELKLNHC